MSRALLRELKAPIVSDEVGGFWSEHSERVTMASWAAAVGVKQEVVERWGRWRPSVDEEYVKTTKLVGDEEVLRRLEERMTDRKVAPDVVRQQSRRLRFQQKLFREGMIGAADKGVGRGRRNPEAGTSPVDSPKEMFDLEEWEVERTDPVVQVGRGTYVMSVVGRSKRRTLHVVGG